jgi:hypothetical protein
MRRLHIWSTLYEGPFIGSRHENEEEEVAVTDWWVWLASETQ